MKQLAQARNVTPAQIAIAWVLRQPGVLTIPKSSSPQRIDQNREAVMIQLTPNELEQLDQAFPPPSKPTPLAVL